MKKAKLISIALCLALLLGALAACGSDSADNQSGAGSETGSANTGQDGSADDSTGSPTPATIRFSRWASGSEEQDFDAWIQEFMDEYPHITVVSEYLPYGEYFTKLRTDLIAGNAPDIIMNTYSDWYPLAQSNVFVDFNTMPGARELFAQLSESAVSAFNIGGQQTSLPIGVSMRLPFINRGLFEDAGVPIPSQEVPLTTAELLDVMNRLSDGLDDDILISNFFPIELMVAITLSANAPVVSLDGTRVTANTPECIAAIEEFRKIIAHPGQIPANEVWSGAWGSPDTAVAVGRTAIGWTGNWSFGDMEEAGIDYMSIPAPIVPGGKPSAGSYINCIVVPESSSNKEAAWTFVQWALSRDGQVSFASFSDTPINIEGAAIVAATRNAENQNGFGAFNIGERYPYPSLPTDFNTLWDEMIEDLQLGVITAAEFAQRLESEGQPMIDEFQANITG